MKTPMVWAAAGVLISVAVLAAVPAGPALTANGVGSPVGTIAPPMGVPVRVNAPSPLDWHDGVRARALFVDPAMIAELAPDETGAALVASVAPEARRQPVRGALRLWTVANAGEALVRLEATAPGRFTPVFRDGPSDVAALRVAVGQVAVVLPAGWSGDELERWAVRTQVTVRQTFAPGLVLLDSGPGLDALKLAASLRQQPSVRSAFPNWWTPKVLK